MDSGIRICRHLDIISDSTASSSRKDHYDWILAGISGVVSDHPWCIDGSLAVLSHSNFCFSTEKLISVMV